METVFVLLLGLAIGIWMFEHAKNKGLENPSVWFWIGLLLGIFGLVTYLYWHGGTKKPAKKTKK